MGVTCSGLVMHPKARVCGGGCAQQLMRSTCKPIQREPQMSTMGLGGSGLGSVSPQSALGEHSIEHRLAGDVKAQALTSGRKNGPQCIQHRVLGILGSSVQH